MSFISHSVEQVRKRLGTASGSLKGRVFAGGVWLGAGMFTEQVVRFGRNILLARILAPESFGIMAVIASATSMIHTVMDMGVREALIQNTRGSEEEYVGAAWWMSLGRGVTFWLIVCILAPFVARFYGNRDFTTLFRVCAFGLVFDGALSARAYVAIKEMKFRKWAIVNHVGGICGVVITIALSFFLRDVWALVLGYVAESASRCIFSYCVCPFLPPRKWDTAAMRDLFKFSRRMVGLSMLNLIFGRADIFVLAKVHSAADLGLYSMSVYLVQTPTSFLMNMLGQTILPAFARVQDDKVRINKIVLQATSALMFLGLPAAVFTFFCGGAILDLAYGHRYAAAAGPLAVASLIAVLNLANGQITSVFFALGVPDLHRRCVAIMAGTMVVLIYPSVRVFGLVGGQLACLVAMICGLSFQLIRVHKVTKLGMRQYLKIVEYAATASLVVAAFCWVGRVLLLTNRPIVLIANGLLGCAVAYAAVSGIYLNGRKRIRGPVVSSVVDSSPSGTLDSLTRLQ